MLLQTRLSFWLMITLILLLVLPTMARAKNQDVTCEGFGADRSLSLKQAMDQCRSIAADQVKGASFKVKQLSLQDNNENAWYSEISTEAEVKGLQCEQLFEQTEQLENGEYHTNLKCRFDLSKAKIIPLGQWHEPGIARSAARHVLIWTIPYCKSIHVRGKRPRTLTCSQNPQTIRIFDGDDKEIIVTAKGYLPKTISLTMETEVIDVLFSNN